jgi:hypothetical protein
MTDTPCGDAWDSLPVTTTGQLALFLGGSADSFTGKLLMLIEKGGPENLPRLELAFPREVAAWRTWHAISSPAPTFGELREALEQSTAEDYPKWQPVAQSTRQALGLLGYGVPDCLPGEPQACGGNFAEHAMGNLAALRALVDHRIAHLGADAQPLVDSIYGDILKQLAAAEPCGGDHPDAQPRIRHSCVHQASNFTPCRVCGA